MVMMANEFDGYIDSLRRVIILACQHPGVGIWKHADKEGSRDLSQFALKLGSQLSIIRMEPHEMASTYGVIRPVARVEINERSHDDPALKLQ